MSDQRSARLDLTYLVAGQLQKHVTLNETLTRLDALVQTAVVSRSDSAQPPNRPTARCGSCRNRRRERTGR